MTRITLQQLQTSERFFKLPKILFESDYYKDLSCEAKCMYAILKDRFELSIKNNWIDEHNHVFLIYTVEELRNILGYGNQKINKLKKELKNFGLLEEERQGLNKPNKIYLTNTISDEINSGNVKFTHPEMLNSHIQKYQKDTEEESMIQTEMLNSHIQKCENHTSRNVKITFQDVLNSQTNDTDIKDTDIKEKENDDIYNIKEIVKKNIELEKFNSAAENIIKKNNELANMLFKIIMSIFEEDRKEIKISGNLVSGKILREKFLNLNYNDLLNVIQNFKNLKKKPDYPYNYLLASLYNVSLQKSVIAKEDEEKLDELFSEKNELLTEKNKTNSKLGYDWYSKI